MKPNTLVIDDDVLQQVLKELEATPNGLEINEYKLRVGQIANRLCGPHGLLGGSVEQILAKVNEQKGWKNPMHRDCTAIATGVAFGIVVGVLYQDEFIIRSTRVN